MAEAGSTSDITTIADFAPEGVEAGVGLALEHDDGRYLFFLAGARHHCPPGELFYAGIGGHREPGEDWRACAQREAREETGAEVELLSAPITWHDTTDGRVSQIEPVEGQRPELVEGRRPLALYEMIHPPGTPRPGELYRIVIYRARLRGRPVALPPDEVRAVIALTRQQVARGLERKPRLGELLDEGASLVAGGEGLDRDTLLYPLGTAAALAHLFRQT
jgi:ADP-ribose pyrophosphatase YjhB (NUDIX family)